MTHNAAALAAAMLLTVLPEARAGDDPNLFAWTFAFRLDADAPLTGAGVFDANGTLVRQLWAMKPLAAGEHTGQWDGRDESGRPAAAAGCQARVVINPATYRNVGVLGNTGEPHDEMQHIQHGALSVAVDARGRIYTANGWEEAGHDFKVMDPNGRTVFHARYQIRNGNPNGAPHAIAVDDGHIYCATHGWASEQWKSKQQIQRFAIADGKHETFTGLADNAGHVQLYEWPEKQLPAGTGPEDARLMLPPVRALAVRGEAIFATDALAGKVRSFHKVTGQTLGEFAVRLPGAIAVGADGRLWVGHERGRVSVFEPDGRKLATPLTGLGEVRSLAFGPRGRLYVADAGAGQVRIYDIDGTSAKPAGTFGRPTRPGEFAPDRFYELRGAAVDRTGHLVTIQSLPTGGARIARFGPDGRCLWEQMALAFCDVGLYAPWRPDEFLTHRFHRLALLDRAAGRWAYRGTVLDGEAKYLNWQHGVLRLMKLGAAEFFCQCYGDGLQVYRRGDDGLYRLAAMVGGQNPMPDGRYNDRLPPEQRQKLGQWTWTDADGNANVDDAEVVWFRKPGQGRYAVFGMNVDAKGNVLYCDHHTRAIWELPLAGTDARGNPVYDWARAREIAARDASAVGFFPLMAVRADDGTIYAFGRSEAWPRPEGKQSGAAWMGGWALRRFDKAGRTLWSAKLPTVCVGMDAIPGGRGVMLGYFRKAHVYHYSPDGLLIGQMEPGEAAGKTTGWMDNTSAVAVQRDPRDGRLDVFGEDSWLNRILWYRVDDRDLRTLRCALRKGVR
ncbi:MAG TPA: FlgD immunoglobulin-like domain containing protein [Phycisphaerae bacterium]|nr:FlgD immunoglobulin-like domain containing protein [Phycisphaerae bacterium]